MKLIETIVDGLVRKGINFVAIDFDLTLIDIHTDSKYYGSANDLLGHVRSFFSILIPALIHKGLYVAIVTFSEQIPLIQEVILALFADDDIRQKV
jgi:hypothetical protein